MIHTQSSSSLPNSISHNVYYVKMLAAAVRYNVGLLKLLLASLLPLRGSKDKASIDACAST